MPSLACLAINDKRQKDVRVLPIKTVSGILLPLTEFADIRQQSSRYNILHQDGQRVQGIISNVVGRDIISFMDELEKTVLQQVQFSTEIYPEFTGAAIAQAEAEKELILLSSLVLAVVMMLVYVAISSFRHVIIMLFNLPFALVGGVIAVLITGAIFLLALCSALLRCLGLPYVIQSCWFRIITIWFKKRVALEY